MTNYALLKIMTKGGCVSITDFVPRKQKLAYDKLHEFRELLKHCQCLLLCFLFLQELEKIANNLHTIFSPNTFGVKLNTLRFTTQSQDF